jgi:hypothetical protein
MSSHLDERSRTLGLLLPQPGKMVFLLQGQRTDVKPESAFSAKLPLEARDLICLDLLGGAKFHIVQLGQGQVRTVSKRCCLQSYRVFLIAAE